MSGTILEFPKKQSFKKRLQDRMQDQRAMLTLSIASILFGSVFVNQLITSQTNFNMQSSRQIASIDGSMNAGIGQNLKWEHDLAIELSQKDLKDSSKLAEKPTLRDEMVFGYLQGKYGMKMTKGRIESLEFIDAQVGEEPLKIDNKVNFLLGYRDAFGIEYHQISLKEKQAHFETYSLINDSKAIVGSMTFNLDDQGRVLSLKLSNQ